MKISELILLLNETAARIGDIELVVKANDHFCQEIGVLGALEAGGVTFAIVGARHDLKELAKKVQGMEGKELEEDLIPLHKSSH